MFLTRIFDKNIAVCRECKHSKRYCFKPVRYHAMFGASKTLDAFYRYNAVCIKLDKRPHFLEKRDKIDNFGFLRGIFDHGSPIGKNPRKNTGFRGANARKRQRYNGALESP